MSASQQFGLFLIANNTFCRKPKTRPRYSKARELNNLQF